MTLWRAVLVALSAGVHVAVVAGALLVLTRWSNPATPVVIDLVEWLRVPEQSAPDEPLAMARERPPLPGSPRSAGGEGSGAAAGTREMPSAAGGSGAPSSRARAGSGTRPAARAPQQEAPPGPVAASPGGLTRGGPAPDRGVGGDFGLDARPVPAPDTIPEPPRVDRVEPVAGLSGPEPEATTRSSAASGDLGGGAGRRGAEPAAIDAPPGGDGPRPGSRVAAAGAGHDRGRGGGASGASGGEAGWSSGGSGGMGGAAGTGGHDYGAYLRAFRQRLQESLHYPLAARRQGLTGTVELEVVLEPSGRVRSVRVLSSSSHRMLDEAAIASIARMTPLPLPGGLPPRPLQIRVPLMFDLR